MTYILALDQGTTSSRALLFDADMQILATAQQELAQYFPDSGWVEHDPEDLWCTVRDSGHQAINKAGIRPQDIAAIGITNQRETTIVWNRATGKPLYSAIVWQDRRTHSTCQQLRSAGRNNLVQHASGLLLAPYFSATKIAWILDNVAGVRAQAEAGQLIFGTVDSWLIWQLSRGKRHVTDATNAARTMLFDIRCQVWSPELCQMLNIPMDMLPEALDCAAEFATASADIFGAEIPVYGVAGDQQAAAIGQTCDLPGAMQADIRGAGAITGGSFDQARLRVDGGMSTSDMTVQFLADIIDAPVDRPHNVETTALGVAWLAGHQAGIYPDQQQFAHNWAAKKTFTPIMETVKRENLYAA